MKYVIVEEQGVRGVIRSERFGYSLVKHTEDFYKFDSRADAVFVKTVLENRLEVKLKILEVGAKII